MYTSVRRRMENFVKKERNIAFIVELLLLFMILIFVIVVITQTFMKSRGQSLYARHLTEAVTLAEEVAEVSAPAENLSEAADRLAAMEQVQEVQTGNGVNDSPANAGAGGGENGTAGMTEATIDLVMEFTEENGVPDRYRLELDWQEEETRFVTKQIRVYFAEEKEPIYTLDTGVYQDA